MNGILASHAATFLAAASAIAAGVFSWRLFWVRHLFHGSSDENRRAWTFFWMTALLWCIAGNRFFVVGFYRGLVDSSNPWPLVPSIGWAVCLLMLGRSMTRDGKCGELAWIMLLLTSLGFMALFA